MVVDVQVSSNFKKEAKKLAKKYASLSAEPSELFTELETKPNMGTHIGDGVYKIRMAIASKGKGKSGGARVMTLYRVEKASVLIFSIYSKGEKNSISDIEIDQLLAEYR